MTAAPAQSEIPSRGYRAWQWFVRAELGPLIALVTLILMFGIADQLWGRGEFVSARNLRVVLNQTSMVAVASLGMTMIIIAGGIDLSVGTALALCSAVLAYGLKHDWSPSVAVAATIATGCLCGFVNGSLISLLRVVPFIVTLGTMTIFLGLGKIVCNETTIFPESSQVPRWMQTLCSTRGEDWIGGWIPNIPPGVYIALGLGLVVSLLLRYTVFGRYVYAIGSNEATARLCGINIPRMKIGVYALAGFLVAIAGIYHFATLRIGDPGEGVGLELEIIAAVVIGGGSLRGGRGSVFGALTGAAIMSAIRSGCDQLEVPNPYQEIIIGVIIIAAVAVDQFRQAESRL